MITKHSLHKVVSINRQFMRIVSNGFNPRITKQNHVPLGKVYLLDPDGNILYDPDGNPLYAGDGT